jgi:hypothetical protein
METYDIRQKSPVRTLRIGRAVFLFLLLLTECSVLTGEDWISSGNNSSGFSRVILDYDLRHYVPLPAEGDLAVISFTNGDVEVSVAWTRIEKNGNETKLPEEGGFFPFESGTIYKAAITLTAKAGYTFDSGVSFYYPAGSVATQPEPSQDITVRKLSPVTYYPTDTNIPIDQAEWLDLTHIITKPTGSTESMITAVNTEYYMGMVEWGESVSKRPVAYTLLYAKGGYFFPAIVAFSHDQDERMIVSPSDGKTVMVYITFPLIPSS